MAMKRVLRGIFILQFAVLLAIWAADQRRGADFAPTTVMACVGEACAPSDPAVITALERQLSGGFAPFAPINFCAAAGDILASTPPQDRGRWLVETLAARDIIAVEETADAYSIASGAGLSFINQVSRLVRGKTPASCHLSRYDIALPASLALFLIALFLLPRRRHVPPNSKES